MNITNKSPKAELSNIIPFKEDDRWYLKLVYKYEDKKGKHTVVIPKAAFPLDQDLIPNIITVPSYYSGICDCPYVECRGPMILHEDTCSLASERGLKDPALAELL